MGEEWVVATADYASESAEELSLVLGEKYIVLEQDNTGWWFCKGVDGKEGWVPFNHLQKTTAPLKKPTKPLDTSLQTKEIMEYVIYHNGPDGDENIMIRALQMLAYKISKEENTRKELVQAGGFDNLVKFMRLTLSNIEVQMTCLQAIAYITIDKGCAEALALSKSSPLTEICEALKVIDHYSKHTILAFNTICNVATNAIFRQRAVGIGIVNVVVHRFMSAENQAELYAPVSLALRNLLVDPGLREDVKPELIFVVTQILERCPDPRVKNAACHILVNIAQDQRLAKEMLASEGFDRMTELLHNEDLDFNIKRASVEIVYNLCVTSADMEIDSSAVVKFLASVLDTGIEELQILAFKALSTFTYNCKRPLILFRELLDTRTLVESLKISENLKKEEDQLIPISITCFLGQGVSGASMIATDLELLENLVNVAPGISNQQIIRNLLVLFYYVAQTNGGQMTLMDAGILKFASLTKSPEAMQAFLGILYHCAQNKANHEILLERSSLLKRYLATAEVQDVEDKKLKQVVRSTKRLLKQVEDNNHTLLKKTKMFSENQDDDDNTPNRPDFLYKTNRLPKTRRLDENWNRKSRVYRTMKDLQEKSDEEKGPTCHYETAASKFTDSNTHRGTYDYADLRNGNFPPNVDRNMLEKYLSAVEFQLIFGMPLNLFQKIEWWRQRQMKRRVGLSNVQSAFREF